MYLRASQLPKLSIVSYSERVRILLAAARAHNPWMFVRIGIVVALMLASTTAVNFLPDSLGFPEWSGTAVAVFFGGVFYVLLLWELNGPLSVALTELHGMAVSRRVRNGHLPPTAHRPSTTPSAETVTRI